MHDRFDRKFARLERDGYRFVANPARERLMARNAAKLLLGQMVKNIQERELRGINQTETKILLKSLASQQQDNITNMKAEKLYTELLVEANAQLGLLALPESVFGHYRELIRTTQYEAMKEFEFDGKDPRVALKQAKISQESKGQR